MIYPVVALERGRSYFGKRVLSVFIHELHPLATPKVLEGLPEGVGGSFRHRDHLKLEVLGSEVALKDDTRLLSAGKILP